MSQEDRSILDYVGDDGEFLYPVDEISDLSAEFDELILIDFAADDAPIFQISFWKIGLLVFIMFFCGLLDIRFQFLMFFGILLFIRVFLEQYRHLDD